MTATTNGNGTIQATDANTMLAATDKEIKKQQATEAKRLKQQELLEAKRTKENEQPELDYAPCKTVNQAMLIMCGDRIDHSESVKGLCATGKVILQISTERIDFGVMTPETLQILPDAMAYCYDCELSSEDILAIALDAKKAWCLGFKTQEAADKATRDKQKNQSKIDKQKVMLEKLKARKAK